jgi:hypothetical protein
MAFELVQGNQACARAAIEAGASSGWRNSLTCMDLISSSVQPRSRFQAGLMERK